MVKYIQFHVNKVKVNGKTILKKDILQQLYDVPFDTSGKNEGYALGVGAYNRRFKGEIVSIFVYSGDGYGFFSDIFFSPCAGIGSVILTNQNNFSMCWRGDLENMMYNHLGERLEFF